MHNIQDSKLHWKEMDAPDITGAIQGKFQMEEILSDQKQYTSDNPEDVISQIKRIGKRGFNHEEG